MNTALFNRTTKTNIVLYKSSGQGRDTYIIQNNGGFYKEYLHPINTKEKYSHSPLSVFRSWSKIPPIWSYHSDGSGRDSYVLINNGGLTKKFKSMAENLENFLRDKNIYRRNENKNMKINLSKNEKLYLNKIKNIRKNVVDRLYNNHFKKNLRYKFINDNKDKDKLLNDDSNNPINSKNCNNNKSYIYNKNKPLEKIKFYKNNLSSNSMNNIFNNNNNSSINNDKYREKYYFRRKFIYDSSNNKLIRYPKIRCTLEQNEKNNNNNK